LREPFTESTSDPRQLVAVDRPRSSERVLVSFVRRHQAAALGPVIVAAIGIGWQYASSTGLISPFLFPAPTVVARSIGTLFTRGFPLGVTINEHLVATVLRVVRGYLVGSSAAIVVGVLIGRSGVLSLAVEPIVTLARSVAVISLLPLSVALLGAGELSRTALIAYAVFWVAVTSTIAAVREIDPLMIRAGRAQGARGVALFRHVALPAALPRIFPGLKTAVGLSFTVIVAVELLGAQVGLGALIAEAQRLFRTDMVVAGMVFIGLVGFVLARALDLIEARLVPWADNLRQGQ